MSDLQTFQTSEAWRTNLKKFLLMERKPEIVQSTLKMTESQRYSLDIDEDLKNIIEQKKNKKITQKNVTEEKKIPSSTTESYQQQEENLLRTNIYANENMSRYNDTIYGEGSVWPKTSDESFEALEKMCEKTVSDPNSTLFKYLNDDGEHQNRNVLVWQKTSDESFEALERMCDKTASDPNSTLFQYLHGDRKAQILSDVKMRSADGKKLYDNDKEDNLLMKINNCTLLDDIEAPSRMWDNTICSDTILQTSPVKIVGLLRPSTIIEEAPDDSANSDISSKMSFCTATKSAQGDVSGSAYETADDSTKSSNKHQQVFDVDQIILNTLEKNEQMQNLKDGILPTFETMDSTIVEGGQFSTNMFEVETNYNVSGISGDLIDLEKTYSPTFLKESEDGEMQSVVNELENKGNKYEMEKISYTSGISVDLKNMEKSYCPIQKVAVLGESGDKGNRNIVNELENGNNSHNSSEESIIEILSDEDVEFDVHNNEHNNIIKTELSSEKNSISAYQEACCFNEGDKSNKENIGETMESLEKSLQFNDTMEEVEYMLKRGMEYLAAEAAAKKDMEKVTALPLPQCNSQVLKTQTNSPTKDIKSANYVQASVSKAKSSAFTTPAKKTPTSTSKGTSSTSKRFDFDIRPFPKFDIFAKPAVHARTKELAAKQHKFSHIVSPVGTYMKKTAQTPLMSSINCKTKNYFNSTAIQELEKESRLYQPQFATDAHGSEATGLSKLPGLKANAKRPLPKKAYISSDLKHIVDERTPVTIPGGKKIQKYLENAMMPAVLRHDGKLKMPGEVINKINCPSSTSQTSTKLPLKVSDTNTNNLTPASKVSRRNNASLADLSVMSGDVSMYTIMDAQKF